MGDITFHCNNAQLHLTLVNNIETILGHYTVVYTLYDSKKRIHPTYGAHAHMSAYVRTSKIDAIR